MVRTVWQALRNRVQDQVIVNLVGVKYSCRNRIGLTTISNPFFCSIIETTFLKFSKPEFIMAKEEGGMLPSSQGGLVQYTDADVGIELDPKTMIAFGFMVAILTTGLHII